MKPVLIDLDYVEAGSIPTLVTAADQRHAQDLPAAVTPDGHVVSCWRFTDEERHSITRGADLYLFMQTHGRPVQPVSLVVGPEMPPDPRSRSSYEGDPSTDGTGVGS